MSRKKRVFTRDELIAYYVAMTIANENDIKKYKGLKKKTLDDKQRSDYDTKITDCKIRIMLYGSTIEELKK